MKHKPVFIYREGMVVSHRNKSAPAQRPPCLVEEVCTMRKKLGNVLEIKTTPRGLCIVTEKGEAQLHHLF